MTFFKIALASTTATLLLAAPAFAGAPGQSYTSYNTGSYGSSALAGEAPSCSNNVVCRPNCAPGSVWSNGVCLSTQPARHVQRSIAPQPVYTQRRQAAPVQQASFAPRKFQGQIHRSQNVFTSYAPTTDETIMGVSRNGVIGQLGTAAITSGASVWREEIRGDHLERAYAALRPDQYYQNIDNSSRSRSQGGNAQGGNSTAYGGRSTSNANADAYADNYTRVDVNQDQLAYVETGPVNVETGVGPAGPAGGGQDSGNLGVSGPQDSGNLGTSGQGMGAWTVPVGTVTQPNIVPGSEEDLFGVGPDGGYANGGQIGYNGSGTQPTGFVLPNPQYIQPIQPVPASNVPTFGSAGS